jgi:Cofactor assembly of complex C subunit B, CCB2/CCB4
MAQSDSNSVLKRLPIVSGIIASLLLVTNRLLAPAVTNSQSRSDVLGIILSTLLVLMGLIWQQVQPNNPESVVLTGETGFELDESLPEAIRTEIAWASHQILNNTVTKSIVVYYQGKVLLRRGILGPNPLVKPGAILDRVIKTQKAIYLVALKLYPGRLEFDYLPENTQGVICQPIGDQGAIILAANAPRSYTQQDEAWISGIADKLTHSLATLE